MTDFGIGVHVQGFKLLSSALFLLLGIIVLLCINFFVYIMTNSPLWPMYKILCTI